MVKHRVAPARLDPNEIHFLSTPDLKFEEMQRYLPPDHPIFKEGPSWNLERLYQAYRQGGPDALKKKYDELYPAESLNT